MGFAFFTITLYPIFNRQSIVLQERIMAEPFGGKQFTHSLLLVLCNRLTTCAVSLITIAVRHAALLQMSQCFGPTCFNKNL